MASCCSSSTSLKLTTNAVQSPTEQLQRIGFVVPSLLSPNTRLFAHFFSSPLVLQKLRRRLLSLTSVALDPSLNPRSATSSAPWVRTRLRRRSPRSLLKARTVGRAFRCTRKSTADPKAISTVDYATFINILGRPGGNEPAGTAGTLHAPLSLWVVVC
jgi:hypothetical protein